MVYQSVANLPWKEILYVIDLMLIGGVIALLGILISEILADMRKEKAKRQKDEFRSLFERIDQESPE